jgi:hypothetical protein
MPESPVDAEAQREWIWSVLYYAVLAACLLALGYIALVMD